MTTFTGSRAGSTFYSTQPWSGATATAWGNVTIATAPVVGDFYEICKLPAGAVVTGGYFRSSDMDTGSPTLTFDVGYAAGGNAAFGAAVASGAALNSTALPAAGSPAWSGFGTITAETTVRLRCAAAATTFAAGTASVVIYYTMA